MSVSPNSTIQSLIPIPASVQPGQGNFLLTADTTIVYAPANDELKAIAAYLADRIKPATGYTLQAAPAKGPLPGGAIYLTTNGADSKLGPEGYTLSVTPQCVTLHAPQPAGLFYAVQTLRQLLPPAIEDSTVQPGPWTIPAVEINDQPRYAWRGAMLDVARHFFGPAEIKHYIDLLAYYKLNILHLHLTDDQGWRLEIKSWPRLAEYGGSKAVNDDPGGYYTQAQYAEIVAYAKSRYITIVPEIDLPGHTNAALAAYAELNKDGQAPPLYTGIEVGFSSLVIEKEITRKFITEVLAEVAAITPGPYLHIGGDEARSTSTEDYRAFITMIQTIVQELDKTMVGWEEIAKVDLNPGVLPQFWDKDMGRAIEQGLQVIISPGSKSYLDMKYSEETQLGLNWAGYINTRTAYDWDPATEVPGVTEKDIIGIEAPLWSETLLTMADVEFMAFPRLPGLAEVGWSPQTIRAWESYRLRLAAHGKRLQALGINFFRSPLVPWIE